MTAYQDGTRLELRVQHMLEADGWTVTRSAGSKGAADLLAGRDGRMLAVQVKRTAGSLGTGEWNRLIDTACAYGATPVLVERTAPGRSLAWWHLTGMRTHGSRAMPREPLLIAGQL